MTGSKLLAQFVQFLNKREIPYMVVGSFSSNYFGIPRATKDADIVLRFDDQSWSRLSEDLPEGMMLDPQGGFEMITATRKKLIFTEGSLFEIEVFHLSEDEFDQERFRRRVRVDLGEGIETWIASAEDVVVQKLRWTKGAARAKDFDDVVKVLLRQEDQLDFDYIEGWCEKHGSLEYLEEARVAAKG
ncbi:MAG: nucleotidyltransferase [Roseibacillus sp.]